ncbi:SA1362 family protein [Priestia flexa]|uniref:SA1362 family protein n=1 Tax=Priestia flexa TaxID=86664 RepID=UPI003D02DE17
MRRPFVKPLVNSLIALGIIGFIYTLATNPTSLLRQAGYIFLFIILFYLVYRFIIRPAQTKGPDKGYHRAVKQSKIRQKEKERSGNKVDMNAYRNVQKRPSAKVNKPLKKKKSNTHLTVIEGKKGKKKNRAFF